MNYQSLSLIVLSYPARPKGKLHRLVDDPDGLHQAGLQDVHQRQAESGPGQKPQGGLLHPEGIGVSEPAPQVGESRHGPGRLSPKRRRW